MPDKRHIDGDVCELICAEHFMRQGYWVFPAAQGSSPIDLVVVNEDGMHLIQVKKDAGRVNPGRNKSARERCSLPITIFTPIESDPRS